MLVDGLAEFFNRAREWEGELGKDEWFFARLRANLLAALSPAEAFEAIDHFVDPILNESDDFLRLELVVVLESLVRHSDTTQAPSKLDRCWDQLVRRVETTGVGGARQVEGLKSWYRRRASSQRGHGGIEDVDAN